MRPIISFVFFILFHLVCDSAGFAQPQFCEDEEIPIQTSIRVMAANLSSGSRQSYDPGEGIRIFQGLRPDVTLIQELNYRSNSQEDIRLMVDLAWGPGFYFFRENDPWDQIPNGVVSRFPILESGEWEDPQMPNRDFAWARIDIPGKRDLWAVSVHLSAGKPLKRLEQAKALVEKISQLPAEDYVLLGGDFNIVQRDDVVIQLLRSVASERGAPKDSEGKTASNMKREKNYDWVLSDEDLDRFQVPVVFGVDSTPVEFREGWNQYSTGLVFDSTTFPELKWVNPIQRGDSRAPGMQHLAIIKDFKVPSCRLVESKK